MIMWKIIKGRNINGDIEYQVSDGDVDERTESYDFTNLNDAKIMLDKLNKERLPRVAYGPKKIYH